MANSDVLIGRAGRENRINPVGTEELVGSSSSTDLNSYFYFSDALRPKPYFEYVTYLLSEKKLSVRILQSQISGNRIRGQGEIKDLLLGWSQTSGKAPHVT